MDGLKKISKGIDLFFEKLSTVASVLLAGIVLICFANVALRKWFASKFYWADEMMRYLQVYLTFLVSPVLLAQQKHLGVDLTDLVFKKGSSAQRICYIVGDILILAFLVKLAPYCLELVVRNTTGTSPAMQINMALIYCCMPLGFGLSIVAVLNNLVKKTILKEE